MPLYRYKARDRDGQMVTGTQQAEDEAAVVAILDRQGLSVLKAEAEGEMDSLGGDFLSRLKRLDGREVILFIRQLATLLRTGTPMTQALVTSCDQATNKKFKVILQDISRMVQEGNSLSDAMEKYPEAFSELYVSMVRVGETGGLLDSVLDRLATLGMQELDMQSRIKSALIYPIVLVVVALIVVNFLIIGVLPKFVVIFSASGAELPVPTQIVLGISWAVRNMWLPIIMAIGLGFLWLRSYLKNERGRYNFHTGLLKIPIFGPLYNKIQVARFTRILSALISSGIPILPALVVVEKTVMNVVIRKAIRDIRLTISEGRSLEEPFKASGIFSPMVVTMVATGERSGTLDKMLHDIAAFYDPEIEITIKNLTALLEPFMLLAMGFVVAFIALSVLLPIFNMVKLFKS